MVRAILFEEVVGGVWRRLSGPPRGDFFTFLGVPRSDIRKNPRPPRSNFGKATWTTPYPYDLIFLGVPGSDFFNVYIKMEGVPLGLFHLKEYGRGEDFFQTLPPSFYIFSLDAPPGFYLGSKKCPPKLWYHPAVISDVFGDHPAVILEPFPDHPAAFFFGASDTPSTPFSNGIALTSRFITHLYVGITLRVQE